MKKIFVTIFLCSVLFVSIARAENVLDAGRLAPEAYTVVFENDKMRSLEIHLKKGAKTVLHSHPDHYMYAFSDAKLKVADADGVTSEILVKSGQNYWKNAETHSVQNIGNEEFFGLLIEIKN